MTKISRILKDYQESGALSAFVNVNAAIDDHTFLTKTGDLLMTLRIEGPDYECRDASELDHIARRFESAVRVLDDGSRIYQYLIKRDNVAIPARTYNDPVVREAVQSRVEHLKNKARTLYSLENYFVITYEGWRTNGTQPFAELMKTPVSSLRNALSHRRTIDTLSTALHSARETLHHKVMSFVVQLPDEIRATLLDKQQTFAFLRRLVNYAPHKADGVRLKYDRFVDYQACDSALDCYPDHLRLDNFYVRVLTLKEPPGQTFAHLLRGLEKIACNFVAVSEWRREPSAKIRALIQAKRRHFHNAKSSFANYLTGTGTSSSANMLVDDSAVGVVAELGSCLQEIELQGRAFGEFSLTVVLYGEDDAVVRRAVAECFKVFAAHDGRLTEERYNLLNAWRAALPGNTAYNLRKLYLLDTNYADLSFLFTLRAGERENAHLGTEYLIVFETEIGTPYFFNLHYQDIAHTAIFGATGSGKSFLVNALLTHLQKYESLTYIFDLGGSYENLTRLFGGAYLPVGIEKQPFTINPFSLPPSQENLHFLFAFSRALIESDSFRMNAEDEHDLYSQLENLYVIEPGQRQLSTLANMLKRNLRAQLQKWIKGGPYEAVFDNIEDNLTFAAFQTFDFEGMDKHPQVLEALLFFILHRASAAIGDPANLTRFKVFVIDEAWRFFRHPTIRQYIVEALKTWRKKNAGMILSTQSSDDLLRSEILPLVVESCSTKMFLANPDMDRKAYAEIFRLNETEADLIARLIPKQQILIKRPEGSKVVNLNVSRKDYWLYTSNPNERHRRDEVFAQHGFKEGLEILARSEK